MKIQKSAAMLLIGIIMLCMSPAYGAESEILQFEDDFSASDTVSWDFRYNLMRVADNALISDTSSMSVGQTSAALSAESAKWQNFRVEFDFNPKDYHNEAFFCVRLRQTDDSMIMLLFRPFAMNYIYPGKGEDGGFEYDFSDNTTYKIKIEAVDENIKIFIGKNGETVTHTLSGAPKMYGGISVGTYGLSAVVDNFKVYSLDNPTLYFPKVLEKLERGESRQIKAYYSGTESVTYTSSAPDIISVSADGTVTAAENATGKALITATVNRADGTTLTATYDAVAMVPLSYTGFDIKNIELYVGENANVSAAVRPDEANKTKLIWRNDNPESIELVGNINDKRGIIAKAVTDDAVITLLDGDGKKIDAFHVKVAERPTEAKTLNYNWECGRKIPENFFGINGTEWLSMLASTKNEREFDDKAEILKGLIGDIDAEFTRVGYEGYDWKTGKRKNQSADTPDCGVDKIVGITGDMNIPICLCADVGQTADDVAEMVAKIRETNSQPLYLEVGNECYDIGFLEKCGTVEEFMQRTQDIYTKVKAVDETVKIAVPILDYELAYVFSNANPSAYDQAMRGKTWNSYIAEHSDCYDAVVIHSYSTKNLSCTGEDDIMDNFSRHSKMLDYGVISMARELFPGKEFWITEFGDLPPYITDGSCESEKSRLQYMKSVGNAVGYVQMLLTAAENPYIENMAYYTSNDAQGFGMTQVMTDETAYMPSYYAFGQVGKLLKNYDYIYTCDTDLQDTDLFTERQLYPNISGITATTERVKVYGFGNDKTPQKIAALNTSAYPVKISLNNLQLKQTFVYGSDNPLPDYAVTTDIFYTSLPSTIPQPTECDGEFENEIVIPPYSMTIADVKRNASDIVYAIAALYDENNTLCDIVMQKITDSSYYFEGGFTEDGCTVKFFVIDELMYPRAEMLTYENVNDGVKTP